MPYASPRYVFVFLIDAACIVSQQEMQILCDFPDVTDISIKLAIKEGGGENRVVTINKNDGKSRVRERDTHAHIQTES